MFERLAKFLCKHAFPLTSSFNRLNELCLEGILAIITSISMRCDPNLQPSEIQMQDFREKKVMKEIFLKSAKIFNSDQKEFIPKLQELGCLPKDCKAKDLAKFFKENPAIDHEKLGEYLGKNNEFNINVLEVKDI
jgi:Sec7-like guanine-nucleotide exchange factor